MKALSIVAAAFMGLLLIYQSVGHFIILQTEHYLIRKEIKHRLKSEVPAGELERFEFSPDEFSKIEWVERNKEFVKDGKMYDLVRRWTEGSKTVLECIDDEQETQLFRKLDLIAQLELGCKPNHKSLLEIHLSINRSYFGTVFIFDFGDFTELEKSEYLDIKTALLNRSIVPSVPPPRS